MSLILSNLKEASEKYLKNNVTGAVLTVPVYFNENQKTVNFLDIFNWRANFIKPPLV